MILSHLTTSELLLHMDNQEVLTCAEAELAERLRSAIDELDVMEKEMGLRGALE